MSRPPIIIKGLVKGNHVRKMLIRVANLWVVKEKNGLHHLEMVIQDAKGDQIHVTTRNREFKDCIEQLIENETYCLYNGDHMVNEGNFKFKFKPNVDFLSGNFNMDLLDDVVGVLQDVVKTQTDGGGKKPCVNITLCDEAGNVIEVALWEDYGKQFMNNNNSNNSPGPTLLILTHAWFKEN
ncbi:unnamed protein product [Lathyrus oleraceus]